MKRFKSFAEQHQQWCVHYQCNPTKWRDGTDACKAGVVYTKLTRDEELGERGSILRRPCIRDHHDEDNRKGQPLCECPYLQWPTREESEEAEREHEHYMKLMLAAVDSVAAIRVDHKGKDWCGVVVCPICKGKLHVRHSGYNGHVWGKCETDGCVSWVE